MPKKPICQAIPDNVYVHAMSRQRSQSCRTWLSRRRPAWRSPSASRHGVSYWKIVCSIALMPFDESKRRRFIAHQP